MAAITVFQIISTVVAAAGVASGVIQARKAEKAQKSAAAERREARNVTEASQQNVDRLNRRKAIREERVRRAKIIQRAENVGAGDASVQLSGAGIVGTNVAAAISAQSSGARAAQGVSRRLQGAADFGATAAQAVATGTLFANIGTAVTTVAGQIDLFKQPAFPKQPKPQQTSGFATPGINEF